MENNKIVVGLDIGTTKIAAIVGRKNEYGKFEILGFGNNPSQGVKQGVVNNVLQASRIIRATIDDAESISGQKINSVVVGIAGDHITSLHHTDSITRSNTDEVISEKDVERLKEQVYQLALEPGHEIIHVLPQEFKVDADEGITEPIGMYGRRLEANFHVVIGKTFSIRKVLESVRMAGLGIDDVVLEPIASASAVLDKDEKIAGVALVDIGGGTTDLAIYTDEIIRHTKIFPFGGNAITEDIKTAYSIMSQHAETIKCNHGTAWPGQVSDTTMVSVPAIHGRQPREISLKGLSEVIAGRVNGMIDMINQEITNYGIKNQCDLMAGIVFTGGGARLSHLREIAVYHTGLEVHIGFPGENLAGNVNKELVDPLYSTAIGLLIEGWELQERRKNQMLEEEVEEVQEKEEPTDLIENDVVEQVKKQKSEENKTKWINHYFGRLKDSFSQFVGGILTNIEEEEEAE